MNAPRRTSRANLGAADAACRDRLLRLMISFYPRDFRHRHGQAIAEAVSLQQAEILRTRGAKPAFRFWFDVVVDLGFSIVRSWVWEARRGLASAAAPLAFASPPRATALSTTPPLGGISMETEPMFTANERFKRRAGAHVWWGLMVATVAHFTLIAYFPALAVGTGWAAPAEQPIDIVIPATPLPDPPADIARPAAPRVAIDAIDTEVTIASLGDTWNAVPDLPEPPGVADGATATQAVWLGPSMTAPRLKNQSEVQQILRREYPALLREARIGGTTVLVLLVDERGRVEDARVEQTSGYDALDAAAISVALSMEFSPALNRDQVQAVWVKIPVTFSVEGGAGELAA